MSGIIQSNPNKPNRLETNGKATVKDEQYDLNYAKWCVSSGFNSQHYKWLERIKTNKRFYQNDQWGEREDVETFLSDSSGQVRNRSQLTNNIIRPMVEQFRGNASILKINASAQNVSPKSINRRTEMLNEKLLKTDIANAFPQIGKVMRENDKTIGADKDETSIIFENLYVDQYVQQINELLVHGKNLNEFSKMQTPISQALVLSGWCGVETYEQGGHQRFEQIEPETFFFDRDARKYDLSDAAFKGYIKNQDVSYILERFQCSNEDALVLENFVSNSQYSELNAYNSSAGVFHAYRLPIYNCFWKDTEKYEYAYVRDEVGYPWLTRVNYTYPGEEEPRFTDKDIITPPDSARNRKLFKKGDKRKLFVDGIRFCRFIPSDIICKAKGKTEDDKSSDIVLESGLLDYQEVDLLDVSNCKFPIKSQTWGFVDGDIFSPIDDAIKPQRFINRIISATDQLINNSGGANAIIDEDAIASNDKNSIYHDMKEGKPITVRTKGKGVPNTVGYYDNTPKQGTYSMFSIIPLIKQMIQDTTGINESLRGESTGSDQLVGVTELLIQRGSLMQEPFYEAISNLFLQMYQSIATVGKRIYIDNEREIVNILGDEGARIIKLSEDLKNEDFNVFIERENDDSILKSTANQMLAIFLQQRLIDSTIFANLYNRSTPNDVTRELRAYAKIQKENQRQQALLADQQMKDQQAQQTQANGQQRQDALDMQNQNNQLEVRRQDMDLNKSLSKDLAMQEKNAQSIAK